MRRRFAASALTAVMLTALLPAALAAQTGPKDAEPAVTGINAAVLDTLPFADRQDFDDARRGFVATVEDAQADAYVFLQGSAPSTVNPSLWRLAQLNALHGLFTVADGIYQVRGFSLGNMTLIEGQTGVIVVDPLSTVGAARAALDLYFTHRPKRPVLAVIVTHSHGDHYGGIKGVVSDAEVASGRPSVIAPAGFMDAVVAESVIAGPAMGRRAQYQFGSRLPRGPRGNVDAGLGKNESRGEGGRSVIAPTIEIRQPFETHTLDGVEFVFQLTPASEAPAELHFYLPASRVLDLAENATQTMHNLLPLRGTEVRDAHGWSGFLGSALERFPDAEILIAQHHWPVWGPARVNAALRKQRDLYKFIHDQTVRLMSHGLTATEIAETLSLPPSLASHWAARGYYGTLSHNSKAVYQKYIGWYDGNPANLNALPPVDAGKRYVEYMGGADAVLARARADFKAGRYRWVAQVVSHVVHADPNNAEARALAADAMEQMGYLSESATWRNAYLTAALELRNGPPPARIARLDADMLRAMPIGRVFDVIATRLNADLAAGMTAVINWEFTDTGERLALTLENAAMTHVIGKAAPAPTLSVEMPRSLFEQVLLGVEPLDAAMRQGRVTSSGDVTALSRLMAMLDEFDAGFPLVEPRFPRQ